MAFGEGSYKGLFDGVRDVARDTVNGAADLGKGAYGCGSGSSCNINLPSSIDIPGAIGAAQNEGGQVWQKFTAKVDEGDWQGAGKDAGHAAVSAAQVAAIVAGGAGLLSKLGFFNKLKGLLPGAVRNPAGSGPSPWDGYLDEWATRPEGPFVAVEGDAYTAARAAADRANRAIRAHARSLEPTALDRLEIHEIKPVKWGGSPTSLENKIALPDEIHDQVTAFWARFGRR